MDRFKSKKLNLKWEEISTVDELEQAIVVSNDRPVLIFKHSTRCSISSMVKNRLERSWEENIIIKAYYLDLLSHRDISDIITAKFKIEHQSPQILLIKNGKCIYTSTHNEIKYQEIIIFCQ